MSVKKPGPAYYEKGGYRFDARLIKALAEAAAELENEKTPEAGRQAKPRTKQPKRG